MNKESESADTKEPQLYGAFVIIRRINGYIAWSYGVDVPMLVLLTTTRETALDAAKSAAEKIVQRSKVLEKKRPCRTAYGVKTVPLGKPLKPIEWNECSGYFEHYGAEP